MTTTIIVQGKSYTIPSDKVQNIVSLLEAYKIVQQQPQQVREVLSNQPYGNDGRVLING
jgi:hypothetical protein